MKRISVVGIGKLGLSMVGAIASRGFQVTGVDVRRETVEALRRGECPISETGLAELLRLNKERISYTLDLRDAVQNTDVTFVVVATPLDANRRFSNAYLEDAIAEIGRALRGSARPHLVTVTSTVMPGTTRDIVKPILERESERKCGSDLLLAYSPEFIALGTVIRDFLQPDWVLLGEDSPVAGDWLEEFYGKVCTNNPPVERMSAINAEIAKLSLNCYVTTKISFANSLAAVCEQVPGADAQTILRAIGLDSRIGRKAILPGLGFGGPCFPRDNLAFQTFARDAGAGAPLAEAVQSINESQPDRIVKLIQSQIGRGSIIAILGAAYKPMTDIIEESQPVLIARRLVGLGYRVRVFDPMAKARLDAELGSSVEIAAGMQDCVAGSAACLMGLPWNVERDPAPLLGTMSLPRLVIDPWHTDRLRPPGKEWRYFSIGRDATSLRKPK